MAFDDSGEGRARCTEFKELDAFMDCLVLGNLALSMRHQMNDDTPVPAGFWGDRTVMIDALVKSAESGHWETP